MKATTNEARVAFSAKAQDLWHHLTANERFGIRFGMFPAAAMRDAELAGYNGHDLSVALMRVAEEQGGMRA